MSSDSDLKQVKSVIRSLLISSPNRLSINQLSRDYRILEGQELPFRQFNYRSSYDFLASIPDTVKILDINDENSFIVPVVSEESAHVYKLVSQQKPSYKRPPSRLINNYPPRFQQLYNSRNNYRPLKSIEKAFNVQRPELTEDFKEDIHKLLQNHPYGMDHEKFDSNVRRILANHYLGDYSVREVLENINEFAFYCDGKVFLRSSDEDSKRSQNDNLIDLTSDGASVIDLISDSDELELSNKEEEILSSNCDNHAFISDRLCRDLHSLFDEPENSNGIWLRRLLEAYQQKFSYPLSPEEHGFSDMLEMVLKLPNVFFVKEYPAEDDHLLLDARKYSRSIEYKTAKMKAKIPETLIEELKKLLRSESQIPADDLQFEYKRMYRKPLAPQEFGFDNMDSFLHRLEDSCQDIIFVQIYDRTAMRLKSKRTDKLESIRQASNDVTYDPYPPEVCNVDFYLETDPIMDEAKVGDQFEVVLGEIYSPAEFYIVHLTRAELLQEMMMDLNEFYDCHETKYKVVAPLVARNLLCACRYSKGGSLWHRVRVMQVVLKTAKIFYVDYGTTEDVDIEQLRYLHKDFAKHPSLCKCARLTGIQPRNGDFYSESDCIKFFRFYHDVDLEVEIVQVTPKFLEVQMYVLEDNDRILVQEKLISLGIANWKRNGFSSPASVSQDSSETRSIENNEILLDEAKSENSTITNAVRSGSLAFFNRMVNDNNLKEKLKSTMKKNDFIPERESPQKASKPPPPGFSTPPLSETPPIPTQPYRDQRFRAPLPQNIRFPYQSPYELTQTASYYAGTPLVTTTPRMPYLAYQHPSNTYYLPNLYPNISVPLYPYQPTPMSTHPFLLPGGINVNPMRFAPFIPPTVPAGANSYVSATSQSFKNLTINPKEKFHPRNSSTPVERRSVHPEVKDDLDSHKMCSTSKLEERKEEVKKEADISHVPVQTTDSTTKFLEKVVGDYLTLDDDCGNSVNSEGGGNSKPSFSTYTSEFVPKTKPKTETRKFDQIRAFVRETQNSTPK